MSPRDYFMSTNEGAKDGACLLVRDSMGYDQFLDIPKSRWEEYFSLVAAMEELER